MVTSYGFGKEMRRPVASPITNDAIENFPSPSTGAKSVTAGPESVRVEQDSAEAASQTKAENSATMSTPMAEVTLGTYFRDANRATWGQDRQLSPRTEEVNMDEEPTRSV